MRKVLPVVIWVVMACIAGTLAAPSRALPQPETQRAERSSEAAGSAADAHPLNKPVDTPVEQPASHRTERNEAAAQDVDVHDDLVEKIAQQLLERHERHLKEDAPEDADEDILGRIMDEFDPEGHRTERAAEDTDADIGGEEADAPGDQAVHHRQKRVPVAVAAFAKKAAMQMATKVVEKLGDVVADKVVEDKREKLVADMEAYFADYFENSEGQFDEVLTRSGDLLSGVRDDMTEARVMVLNSRGTNSGDTFAPPDQEIRMDFTVSDDRDTGHNDDSGTPVYYPNGLGSVLMNGCYGGSSYGDPCNEAFVPMAICGNMIDGANFLGTGFDGRGEYSTDSSKKSLIQRACRAMRGYKGYDVPDPMTVQGIYDTDVETYAFGSTEEYRVYLEDKAAVTAAEGIFQQEMNKVQGHMTWSPIFGLIGAIGGGGGSASGSDFEANARTSSATFSTQESETFSQTFVALLELNVFRYEIFLDFVTPEDLNLAFLRDFLALPYTYFAIGADREFQNFILRWGTHYVTSAKFGGQLKIIKTKEVTQQTDKESFAEATQSDFKQVFSTYSAYQTQMKSQSWWHDQDYKKEGKTEIGTAQENSEERESLQQLAERSKTTYSNELMLVQGGDQRIAAAISEFYTPSFGTELRDWLESIGKYPKAFEFTMQLVSELFDMNFDLLFPHGLHDYGCFGSKDLSVDEKGRKYYVQEFEATNTTKQVTEIRYCNYESQYDLSESVTQRRMALERAIAVYLAEGPLISADFSIAAGEPGCETSEMALLHDDNVGAPSWQDMISGSEFTVIFDLPAEIPDFMTEKSSFRLKYIKHRWLTLKDGVKPRIFDGHRNGNSGDIAQNKVSVGGLVMSYDEDTGMFTVAPEDFAASAEVIPDLPAWVEDMEVGRAEYKSLLEHLRDSNGLDTAVIPCNVRWSNAHRIDPTDGGKCIHFTAASEGDIFVVFAAIPKDHESWLTVEISPDGVALYKSLRLVSSQFERGARGLGSDTLYQSYFVCITEDIAAGTTTVQFGKTSDSEDEIEVWVDDELDEIMSVHYYAFGSGTDPVKVMRVTPMDPPAEDAIICGEGLVKSGGRCLPI